MRAKFHSKRATDAVALFPSHLRYAGAKTGGISPTAHPCREAVGYKGCAGLHIHVGAQGMTPKSAEKWRPPPKMPRLSYAAGLLFKFRDA